MRTFSNLFFAVLYSMTTVLLLAAMTGCSSGPQIRHDKDPTADISAYKSFAFYDAVADGDAPYSTLLARRLVQSTRAQIEKQGYVYDESNPDLRVNVMLRVVEKQELRSTPNARGYAIHRSWSGTVDIDSYHEGTLVIDLVDTKRNVLVWRGVAEGRLNQDAINNPGPVIDQAVGEIFTVFPNGKRT